MTTLQASTQTNETNVQAMVGTPSDTATKRQRRTPEEARQARLDREQRIAEKNAARIKRQEEILAKAKARQEKLELRKKEIAEKKAPVREPKAEVPVIQETVQKRVTRDLKAALKEIGTKHGIDFSELQPRLTQHGQSLSLRIVAHVAGAVSKVKRAVGATKEAARFMEFHKMVGIKPSVLGKEVQLAGDEDTYKVLGLKGRAHDVVLQKIGSEDGEVKTVAADEFKTRMVSA